MNNIKEAAAFCFTLATVATGKGRPHGEYLLQHEEAHFNHAHEDQNDHHLVHSQTHDWHESEAVAHAIAVITDRVFFDITINDVPKGRITIGLFGDEVPRTVDNFMTIAQGTAGVGKLGEEMDYWGTNFHRIIPTFMM